MNRRLVVRGGLAVAAVLVVEYFVVPTLVDAGDDLARLRGIGVSWLAIGTVLELAAIGTYALLGRALFVGRTPGLWGLVRVVFATTAISHLVPAGAAAGNGLGYRLLTQLGAEGPVAGAVLATQALISAVVLNVMLWLALLVSLPVTGTRPIYVAIVFVGVLALLLTALVVAAFTRGTEHTVRIARVIGERIRFLRPDRLERLVRVMAAAVEHVTRDRGVLRRVVVCASLNWLLDAAALWAFVAAFGARTNPLTLFVAYGVANVLAAIPLTPAGLGIVEASAASLLVAFGLTRGVATLGVLGWRLANFWLPIPLGGAAYLSLEAEHHRHAAAQVVGPGDTVSNEPAADGGAGRR